MTAELHQQKKMSKVFLEQRIQLRLLFWETWGQMAVRWPHISSNLIRKSDFMCTVLRSDIHSVPWLKATYPDNNYVWQQNGASAHTSKQ